MANVINGTNGNDVINGTFAADEINGLAGDDTINGLTGDTVNGGEGDDVLSGSYVDGGLGFDTMKGVSSGTTFVVDEFGEEVNALAVQGEGRNVVILDVDYEPDSDVNFFYYENTGVQVDEVIIRNHKELAPRFIVDAPLVRGDDFANSLEVRGVEGDVVVFGGGGDDSIVGGGTSNVSYYGEAGDDRLTSRLGSDYLSGGEGMIL
jgi:Ca2+-binding RTX toxin-like protein